MKLSLLPLATAAFVIFGASAQAQILVYDSFTDTPGLALLSHTPDTDTFAPTTTYFTTDENNQPTDTISASGTSATASASSSSLVSISPSLTGEVTASADIQIGTLGTDGAPQRGIFLGFNLTGEDYSSPTAYNPDDIYAQPEYGAYAGVVVNPNGTLEVQSLDFNYTLVTTTGTNVFNPNAFETLSYSVNLGTGQITNLTFNGNSYTVGTSDIFSGDLYEYNGISTFGYYSSGDATGQAGAIDNLSLVSGIPASVPEPSTYALILAGIGVLLLVCRRKVASVSI